MRFSIRTALGIIFVIGLWLASFSMGVAGFDVRHALRLLIVVAVAANAFHFRGKYQAFWIGFLAVLLVFASSGLSGLLNDSFRPAFQWPDQVARYLSTGPQGETDAYFPIHDTLALAGILIVCALAGCISLASYNRAHMRVS